MICTILLVHYTQCQHLRGELLAEEWFALVVWQLIWPPVEALGHTETRVSALKSRRPISRCVCVWDISNHLYPPPPPPRQPTCKDIHQPRLYCSTLTLTKAALSSKIKCFALVSPISKGHSLNTQLLEHLLSYFSFLLCLYIFWQLAKLSLSFRSDLKSRTKKKMTIRQI